VRINTWVGANFEELLEGNFCLEFSFHRRQCQRGWMDFTQPVAINKCELLPDQDNLFHWLQVCLKISKLSDFLY
jgi:hypothetical protein